MESLVLVWLKRIAWLVPPIVVGMLAYTVATVLRERPERRWMIALIAFGITLLIILIILFVKWMRRRRKAGKFEAGLLGGSAGSADRRAEIDALRKTWRESVSALKSSGAGGGGRRALAVLPWYVIIGAPASGKSTLLRQSGIDFPVGDAAIRGLQGTRNCDWWFSNIGIFLDTAGRYMSDESAAEWGQFLDLVRKHRTEAPIQGVIVALPAPDLLNKSASDLDADARRIRARLDELIDHLGINFPVWVVLTKVDLVGGFAEMFSHVDAQTRRQMVGWTAEFAEGARFDGTKFETRFRSLVDRMRDVRPVLVGHAPLRERAPAYAFPDEFAAIGDPLGAMLRRMFEPNVYQETPLFRGLFVTSATQQGTPLQKAAARVRELLGVAAAPAAAETVISHAYFVQDLVHERIVPDRHMTWTTKMEIERGKTRRIGINLTLASFGVFLFFCVIFFGLRAAAGLDKVETDFQGSEAAKGGVERGAALWNAAEKASDDNYDNLGLSSQLNLKLDLQTAERETFQREVLAGTAQALIAEVDEAAKTGPGPDALISAWAACAAVRDVIRRAIAAWDDPAAADAVRKLTPTELQAFERLRPQLAKKGVVAAQGLAYPIDFVEGLLHKRRFDTEEQKKSWDEAIAAIDAIDGTLVQRASDYVALAAKAVTEMEQDEAAWTRFIDERLSQFKKTCEKESGRLEGGGLSTDDLDETLNRLTNAAAGTSKSADGEPSRGAEGDRQALVGSIAGSVASLRKLAETSSFLKATMRGDAWATLERHTGGAATAAPAQPATAASANREAKRRALDDVSNSLRELSQLARSRGFIPDPWPDRSKTVRDAKAAIDKDVGEREKAWRDRVEGPLTVLGLVAPPPAPSPGRAVLWIEPVLRRNAMLLEFVKMSGRGGYASAANEVLRVRLAEDEFDRKAMADELEELLEVVSPASDDPRKLVATDVNDAAAAAVKAHFEKFVDAARDHWRRRIDELPPYDRGDAWKYLRDWTKAEGKIARLSDEFSKTFGGKWEGPSASKYKVPTLGAAQTAWTSANKLRDSFRFYWSDFDRLKAGLVALEGMKGWTPEQKDVAALEDLAKVLKADGDRPVWDAKTLAQMLDSDVTENLRTSLEKAVQVAEAQVLSKVVDSFNRRWTVLRADLLAALKAEDEQAFDQHDKRFDALTMDLSSLFGEGLSDVPGGRIEVPMEFRRVKEAMYRHNASRHKVMKGFSIDFGNLAVPYRKEGAGSADYVFAQLVYEETGQPPQTHTWKTGSTERFGFQWTPGRGKAFRINLVDANQTSSKPFKTWRGSDPLLDALRDGGADRGEQLSWSGEGEFATWTNLKMSAKPDDPQIVAALLSRSRSDPSPDLQAAPTCVELVKGR